MPWRRRRLDFLKKLVTVPEGPVAFTAVRVFDADAARFLADQTVVVDHGVIVAAGARQSVAVPARARVIDGPGKTLIPGLWDCHMHVGDDFTGLQELSLGVTSVRDPGNDDQRTIDRRRRVAAGALLFPNVYPSSLIDGKGPYTAQVANVATSQAEAIKLVDKAKVNDFTGISSTEHSIPRGCPRLSLKPTNSACMSTDIFQRGFGRSTLSTMDMTKLRT